MILRKTFRFEASHVLPKHPGKCSRLHGHSWTLHIGVSGRINPETGFVMDYSEISNRCESLIKELDHHHLNEFITYPSSENVVLHVARELVKVKFPWCMIALEETCTSYCYLSRKDFDAGEY